MINMRGGLANLGLPSTTVQLIVWTDALMSAETKTEPYFADVPKQIAIQSYTPQEAVYVTNFSSPNRTQHPGYDRECRASQTGKDMGKAEQDECYRSESKLYS